MLKYWDGRFEQINLDDANLPAIVHERLLKPKEQAAKTELDVAFDAAARMPQQAWEILLDTHGERGTREAFRLTYPFSPAFTHAMVDISGALQRERTALKLMQQLLVNYRDTLTVGQLMPLGAIFALAGYYLAVHPRAVVVVDGIMPGGEVVPEDEVARVPAEADGVVRGRGVGQQERQEGLALGLGEAGQPLDARADEQPLAARVAVGADDRVLDRLGDRGPIAGPVVLERRQVLAAEDQDLVGPECLPQGLGGGLVNGHGQVQALDLGANQRAGRADLEATGQGLGHVILLQEIRRTR